MSKGSKRRPTDEKKFGENWDRIFKPRPEVDESEEEEKSESDASAQSPT